MVLTFSGINCSCDCWSYSRFTFKFDKLDVSSHHWPSACVWFIIKCDRYTSQAHPSIWRAWWVLQECCPKHSERKCAYIIILENFEATVILITSTTKVIRLRLRILAAQDFVFTFHITVSKFSFLPVFLFWVMLGMSIKLEFAWSWFDHADVQR